ncbi:hypothetical protein LINGRAHAP2_LOCUS38226 [Linum grandiflorum]
MSVALRTRSTGIPMRWRRQPSPQESFNPCSLVLANKVRNRDKDKKVVGDRPVSME